jgi:hypothetical protein
MFFGLGGLLGIAYGGVVFVRIHGLKLDWGDRFWFLTAPPLSYAVMIASAWAMWSGKTYALSLLAVSLIALLVTGMHNLWDMATFMILSTPPDKPAT